MKIKSQILIFCYNSAVRYYHRAWTFGDFLCQVFPFVFYSNVCISMMSMILMTINRYILITFQHLYPKIYTTKMIIIQLFFAWFIAFLIMVSSSRFESVKHYRFVMNFDYAYHVGVKEEFLKINYFAVLSTGRHVG